MGSATTFGGKLWVFGTSGGHGTATKKARIHVFSSADPTNSSEKAWTNTEVLQLPDGLQPFNTDVHHVVGGDPAHPERQHIMVIETNGDAFPHSSWGAFFAATNSRTPDHGWKVVAPQTAGRKLARGGRHPSRTPRTPRIPTALEGTSRHTIRGDVRARAKDKDKR